ncbi:MAG: hypothetical protein HY547_08025 [Elusimicrobia bacterium]|nr:hypothetical protein [Elusimicrobiota bacterium]
MVKNNSSRFQVPGSRLKKIVFRLLLFWMSNLVIGTWNLCSQPYYSAKKGLNCAACHVNPAGAGMRRPSPSAPTLINDSLNLGADFRVLLTKTEGSSNSSFNIARGAFYVLAEPASQISLLYSNNQGAVSESYAMIKTPDYPMYARAGRFFVPYGLQVNDPDNSSYSRIAPFGPSVGFSMAPTQTDTGVEFGLNPKSNYFLNMALTNGAASGGADNSDPKAITARWGIITKPAAIGATFFRNKTSPATSGETEQRYGIFGWTKIGPLVILGEGGWGSDTANATGQKTNLQALFAEIDYELFENFLMRGRLDHLDPNTKNVNDERSRYILGSEWFLWKFMSLETQYRMIQETPSSANNEGLLLTHVWF